ncbi:MAG: amidohydrolase [Bacteroidales bacterium]|nr:amidohydrolase [Bacteroidales bacterium]MCF8404613.1 amidohydrolase [Bacteroidales bacterium]
MNIDLDKHISLRRLLHKHPELSDFEDKTAQIIFENITPYSPDKIINNIGGKGFAVIFKGKVNGPKIMFRCELDALPIEEINNFEYRSIKTGISHKCGHDGHMAVLVGLAEQLHCQPPVSGQVTLLFQPSEETGQGAIRVINDPNFNQIKPDHVFAFHNIPGFEKHKIILRKGIFSAASVGLIIRFIGKTSHAAEPENGINPAFALAAIIKKIERYSQVRGRLKIVTPVFIKLGERAFGTSPGFSEIMLTLRTSYKSDLNALKKSILGVVHQVALKHKLKVESEWVEEFPNTVNDSGSYEIVNEAAKKAGLDVENPAQPFRWSEDFGHFQTLSKGAFFGIGAGKDTPALHNPDYDFPDDLIETGIKILTNIYQDILK